MKEQKHNNAVKIFRGGEVKITSEGRRHFGLVIRYHTYIVSYTKTKGNQKSSKEGQFKLLLTVFRIHLNDSQNRLNDIVLEKGISNWFTPYLIKDQRYV